MEPKMDHAKRFHLLTQLQEVDFVIVELQLYLDTHPDDKRALDQYNWYVKERNKLRRTYESHFGPLYNFGLSCNQYPCGWNEGPWPWEI
ncbi:MAG: spore coat protein CotJB [Thermoactinomyces sp.]